MLSAMSIRNNIVTKYLRSLAYLLTTFPVSCALFALVSVGAASGALFPVAAILFLLVMSLMEYVARFEVRRTNRMLGTDFEMPAKWLTTKLFSWDGVRERVTSLRGWMTMLYVTIAFGWSLFTFALIAFGLASLFVVLLSIGIVTLASFDRAFEVVDGTDFFSASIHYTAETGHVQLNFSDPTDSGSLGWNFGNNWGLLAGIILMVWSIYVTPGQARGLARMVQGLLSGGFEPELASAITRVKERFVSSQASTTTEDTLEPLSQTSSNRLEALTEREREILKLMADGLSNAAIGKALFITEGSVEKHISNIMFKLDLPVTGDSHRRVLAVLAYRESQK